jgi:hypothetical protein
MHSLCNKNRLGIFGLNESECGIFARRNLVSEIDPREFSRSTARSNLPTLTPRIARLRAWSKPGMNVVIYAMSH